MPVLKRTIASDPDFIRLAEELEAELKIRDGDDHVFYATLNQVTGIQQVVLVYEADDAVACGAFREDGPGIAELKRMYVAPAHRRKGFALMVLKELESCCREAGYSKLVLETGLNQPEAIAFYGQQGYEQVPAFGKYTGSPNSVCFTKQL